MIKQYIENQGRDEEDMLDNEINKHEMKENIVVYRTFSYTHLLEAQERKKISKRDIIIDQGFMGCSLVKETLLYIRRIYNETSC